MAGAEHRIARKLQDSLEKFALSLPEAWKDTPWDESHVTKVRKKIFMFIGTVEEPGVSVKLQDSLDHGLSLPGAAPVGYGLGKHGWTYIPLVGISGDDCDVLVEFIEESYRAVAPKRLLKQLDDELSD